MKEIAVISYSQWLELIDRVKEKGVCSDEMYQLHMVCPQVNTEKCYYLIQNEISKLETQLLRKVMYQFESSVNRCLEDFDLELLNHGIRVFKKSVQHCFFFNDIEQYPYAIRKNLCNQLIKNLMVFTQEYAEFVKKLREDNNSLFIEDFDYIYKKAKLKKYIEEFNVYG
ncbi:MAG: hypothetical protein HFJ03_09765 [Lachnospira sp.]|nr:hypothetical protein [Lachnospira sp.]